MDLKDWKKVNADKHTATLVHPKGHTMTIAMKALPKILQQQIARLEFAHGGDVLGSGKNGVSEQGADVRSARSLRQKPFEDESSAKVHEKFAKEEARGRLEMERKTKPKMKGLADGGQVSNPLDPDPQKAREAMAGANSGGPSLAQGWQNLKSEMGVGDQQQQPRKNYAGTDDAADSVVDQGQPPVTVNVAAPAAPAAPQAVVAPIPQGQLPPNLVSPDQTLNAPAAVQLQQKAIGQQAQIDAAKAKALDQNTQENIEQQQSIQQAQANNYHELKDHADDFAAYINNNPVNPRHYQESMTSGQKASTAIGLFLGGFGTPFGGHNYAMDFLNKQIDRDIAAQQQRSDNQKTVWGAYEQLYHDSTIATNLAKVSANDILVQKTNLAAAKLGTPEAIKAANAMAAQKAIENNQILLDSAGRLGTLRTGGGMPGGKAAATSGAANPAKDEAKHPLQGSILQPGSEQQFERIKYKLKAMGREGDLPELANQFTAAQQADKALKDVNDTFIQLWKLSNRGGVGGRIGRTMSPHTLAAAGAGVGALIGGPVGAGVGTAAGEAVGQGVHSAVNTSTNREYEALRTKLKGQLAAAFKNTNLGSGDINDIVDSNSPEYGDENEALAVKLKAIRDKIRINTPTSLLKTWGLTKE